MKNKTPAKMNVQPTLNSTINAVINAMPYILTIIQEAVLISDKNLEVLFCNDAAKKLLGLPKTKKLGFHLEAIMPKTNNFKKILNTKNKKSHNIVYAELQIQKQKKIAIEISASTFVFAKKIYYFCTLRDLTEYKKTIARLSESHICLNQNFIQSLKALANSSGLHDPYTLTHQNRTAQVATNIAQEMGLTAEQIKYIALAAIVHDIGKIYVPSEILNRPSKLSKIEMQIMEAHPEMGFNLIKDINFPWPIAQMILQHHERLDGSGYPYQLKKEAILLETRILSVADVIDAMSSVRPYHGAHSIKETLKAIIKNKGILYDEDVVNACVNFFRKEGIK